MNSPWTREGLECLGTLGNPGSFGSAFKAQDNTGLFAIKQIPVESFLYKSGVLRQNPHKKEPIVVLKREAKLLSQLNHQNVVKYFDSWFEGPQSDHLEVSDSLEGIEGSLNPQVSSGSSTISGDNFLYIKMELAGDFTLHNWISSRPTQVQRDEDLNCIHEIFFQLLKGLAYIHEKNLAHRDLKPDNIFMDNTSLPLTLKIGDFGLARHVNAAASVSKFTVGVGASMYRSPEVDVTSDGKYDTKSDVYSLGLIFLETLCALESVEGDAHDLMKWRNGFHVEKFYEMKSKYPVHMDLISRMTFKDSATARPSPSEIIGQIFRQATENNVGYFEALPQWYTSFLTPLQYLTPSSGQVLRSHEHLKESDGQFYWNPTNKDINRPTCVYIGLTEDLERLKEHFFTQMQFYVEVTYLHKQTGISATEDYKESSIGLSFNETERLGKDGKRKSDSLAGKVLSNLATAKRSLMGNSEGDGDYLKDYSVIHYMMKAFPALITIRSDTNPFKTTMEFEHFLKEHGSPPNLSYWLVKPSLGINSNIPCLLRLRHLEFSTPQELLYHVHDEIEMFKKLQNGFTLSEKQRIRIQPTPGYQYDSSSFLEFSFYNEKEYEKLHSKKGNECCVV